MAMKWFKRFWRALNQPSPTSGARVKPSVPPPCSEPLNNFTPRAQQVLALSRKEADRFNHNFIGTEHLLLGLIALGKGTAVTVLQKLGLDLETVRREIELQVGTGPDSKMIGNIPFTSRVKRVLALASKEARSLNHTYVGTEHILLGLLREGDGVAARVLKNLEVDIEQTRLAILRELDPNFSVRDDEPELEPVTETVPVIQMPGTTPTTASTKPRFELIDLEKRYDIYCSERNQDVIVYRNALFKGLRRLFRENHDSLCDFFELEQVDGQIVYVAKYSVIKFCAPGGTANAEIVPGQHS